MAFLNSFKFPTTEGDLESLVHFAPLVREDDEYKA